LDFGIIEYLGIQTAMANHLNYYTPQLCWLHTTHK